MKFVPLIWAGIWRKRGRALLIFVQVCVAFALFGTLQGLRSGVAQAIAGARADLLIVNSSVAMATPLPIGYREKIKSVAGVKVVAAVDFLSGTYQKAAQQVDMVALIPNEDWLATFPDFRVEPSQLAAFKHLRTGVLVSESLARKYDWKVGQKIPIVSTELGVDGPAKIDLDIVGLFSAHEDFFGSDEVAIMSYLYLDELRQIGRGTVKHFNVVVSNPSQASLIADRIDSVFSNSGSETKTQSARELAQSEMQAIGNLDFTIRAIVSAALVALLFSTATMQMQSVRERVPELATLRAVGFSSARVFRLLLAEGLAICLCGAAVGLTLAVLLLPLGADMVPGLTMPVGVIAAGLLGAIGVALISVLFPAIWASRLEVAAAIAGR